MPHLHENLGSFGVARTAVRPGCVGLWQVGMGTHRLIGEAPEFDLFYLRRWSVRFDLWILFRYLTLLAGLQSQVGLDDVPSWAIGRGLVAPSAIDAVVDLSSAERAAVAGPLAEPTLTALRPAGG
jgi:hypothetical protein